MIVDSEVWKRDLTRSLRSIRRQAANARKKRNSKARAGLAVEIEKFVFISVYVIRKLSEADKLSDELESSSVSVQAYSRRSNVRVLNQFARFDVRDHYDFRKPKETALSVKTICNLFIHSFIFIVRFRNDEIWLLFNSDKAKDRELFRISFETFCDFVQNVIDDEIRTLVINDLQSGKPKVRKSRNLLKETFDL